MNIAWYDIFLVKGGIIWVYRYIYKGREYLIGGIIDGDILYGKWANGFRSFS